MTEVVDIEHDMGVGCRPVDRRVAALAARQHGVVARAQLLGLGLGRGAIGHRLAQGRLYLVHGGVYAVGHPEISGRGRWMAAVLTGGPAAVLSHRSAAALWGLLSTSREAIDVTVPGRSRRGRPRIAIHQVRHLPPADRAVSDGIPVTTVARTLLDVAAVVHPRQLARALEEAERLRLLDMQAIEGVLACARTRRGRRSLATLVAEHRDPAPATRSELERRLLDLCRDAGLPAPSVNVLVHGFEVDMCWSDRRLVVEVDGHAFHRTRAAFERDRLRDATLQLAGYRVLRVTHRRLEAEPAAVADAIRRLLALT